MCPSAWNVDRSETGRALRYADRVIRRRHSLFADYAARPNFPVTCHVFPLGRMRSGDDRLAMIGDRSSELVPPSFGEMPPKFGNDGIEYYRDPAHEDVRARDVSLTWFRPGWAELHMYAKAAKDLGGVGRLVRETIPFLIGAATDVLQLAPPTVVCVRVTDADLVFDEGRGWNIVRTPATVVWPEDLGDRWSTTADRLLNGIAQGFGRPSFSSP